MKFDQNRTESLNERNERPKTSDLELVASLFLGLVTVPFTLLRPRAPPPRTATLSIAARAPGYTRGAHWQLSIRRYHLQWPGLARRGAGL